MGLSSDLIFKIYIKTKYNQGYIWLYYDVWNIEIDINNVTGLTVHYFIEIVNLDPKTVHTLTLYYIQSSTL